MKKFSIYVLVLFSFISCQAQSKQDLEKEDQIVQKEKPKGKWKVNKKFDKNGNLIQYDSVYTYSYKGKDFSSSEMDMDSIMNQFRLNFQNDLNNPFNSLFFKPGKNDFENSFFDEDYYFKNIRNKNFEFNSMIKEMDSIRNLFLNVFYPNALENKNNANNKENKL